MICLELKRYVVQLVLGPNADKFGTEYCTSKVVYQ